MKSEVLLFKAFHGDSILIKTFDESGENVNILIDGGPSNAFEFCIRKEISHLALIHLLVLTHIDSDHIGGIIKFIKSSTFKYITILKYWINSKNLLKISTGDKISYSQGVTLDKLLLELGESTDKFAQSITVDSGWVIIQKNIRALILSPTQDILNILNEEWPEITKSPISKETEVKVSSRIDISDLSVSLKELAERPFMPARDISKDKFNSSSIAFLLDLTDCKILFLGDSRPEIIIDSLTRLGYNKTDKRLKVNYVKLSHHGSKNNTSNDLLDMIECHNFIFLTNGGSAQTRHPDRQTIARVLHHPNRDYSKNIKLFFNYPFATITRKCGNLISDAELKDAKSSLHDDTKILPI